MSQAHPILQVPASTSQVYTIQQPSVGTRASVLYEQHNLLAAMVAVCMLGMLHVMFRLQVVQEKKEQNTGLLENSIQ